MNKPNTLIPEWKFLDDVIQGLQGKKSLSIQVASGLPYLCLRLALEGYSTFVLMEETKAEVFAQDTGSFAHLFESLHPWSIGYLPEKVSVERNVLLESALRSD